MSNIKETLTKVVLSELNAMVSKKSSGTKIATIVRDIPITIVKPFSL